MEGSDLNLNLGCHLLTLKDCVQSSIIDCSLINRQLSSGNMAVDLVHCQLCIWKHLGSLSKCEKETLLMKTELINVS